MRHLPHRTLPRDSQMFRCFCVWASISPVANNSLHDDGDCAPQRRKIISKTPVCCSAIRIVGPRLSIVKLQASGNQAQRIVPPMDAYACFRRSLTRGGGDYRKVENKQSHVSFSCGYIHRVRVLVLARRPEF